MHLNLKPRSRLPRKKKSSSRLGASISLILFMIGLPIFSVVGMEFLERGNFHETMQWITSNQPLFLLNIGLTFCLLAFLYALVGSLAISGSISTLILGLMAIISYMKVKMIGEPFFPWDILLNKESMDIASLVTGKAAMIRIIAVALAILIVLALRWVIPRVTIPIIARIGLGLFSLYALYAFGIKTPLAGKVLDHAGVNEIVWDQTQNYANNGLTLAFTLNVKNSIVQKPETYSEQALASAAAGIQEASVQAVQGATAKKASLSAEKKPNVIFVMSEAFWDPTLLTNVTFSEDPLPTIHRLQKESGANYLLSPQYGGGTSNVEFEVLTGNSMSALPGGSIPYQQYISKPLPSLASYFADQGYKSMGIHSYEGWFWDRNSVYKQLGFESFKSSEHFVNPETKGYFISDAEVAKNVINEVDKTENPMFIYTVTMENHGPYDDPRYGENQFKATGGNLSAQAKSILETYAQGAHDADQSLQKLIDHFKDSDEPTMIVFYGDHLPMLGMDYQVYKEAGFISTSDANKWSLEEIKKMHSTPLVTWSNFDMPKQDNPVISASFLGAKVLDMLHLQKPANFALDAEVSQKVPGLLSNLVVDKDGQLHASVPESAAPLVTDYRNVQYDLMFGKQYLAAYVDHDYLTKGTQADYNAEFGAINAGTTSEAQGSEEEKPAKAQ